MRAEPAPAAGGQEAHARGERNTAHRAERLRVLQQIHGLGFVPSVVDAAFKDWGDDPFGGGWNNWNIGVKSWEVKERIVQPLGDKVPLHICGESYSDAQGWVEGALQTADLMLAKFGLSALRGKAARSAKKKR